MTAIRTITVPRLSMLAINNDVPAAHGKTVAVQIITADAKSAAADARCQARPPKPRS